jgi:hypothetical protein
VGVVVVGHTSRNNYDPHPARLRFAPAVDPPHKGEGRSALHGWHGRHASAAGPRTRGLRERRATPIHNVKQPGAECARHPLFRFCRTAILFELQFSPLPRRLRRPGDRSFILLPPPRGWRSADRRVFLVVVPRWLGRGAHLAIGALASRRSAVAVLGCESPRISCPALPPEPSRGPRRGALIEPWRRPPTSRSALRRDATPAPPSGSSPETPLIERDVRILRQLRVVVNKYLQIVVEKSEAPIRAPGRSIPWSLGFPVRDAPSAHP